MSRSGPAGIGGGGNPKTRNRLGSLGRGGRAWPIHGGRGGGGCCQQKREVGEEK